MLSCRHLGFEWPSGQKVIHNFSFDFHGRRIALVGANGAGKSTLLRLLVGELSPTQGECRRTGRVIFVPQEEERPEQPVWQFLGDLEQPAEVWERLPMTSDCRVLSGGEWMLLRILKALAERPDFILLDEPTTHLDEARKSWLLALLWRTGIGFLIVTHDRDVLHQMNDFLILRPDSIESFHGSWEGYEQERAQALERSFMAVDEAKRNLSRLATQSKKNEERQAKRMRRGAKNAADSGLPKILLGARKRQAQEVAGRLSTRDGNRLRQAEQHLQAAQADLYYEERPFFKMKRSRSIAGQEMIRLEKALIFLTSSGEPLWSDELNLILRGGERLWIRGENGAGKTSLLRALQGGISCPGLRSQGVFENRSRFWGEVSQDPVIDGGGISVWDWFRQYLGGADVELRNSLAQFQFPMERLQQACSELSGGERMRAQLARLLLAEHPPELLFLDEPTTHLDLPTREWLEQILHGFDGALVLITHERSFAQALGVERDIQLTRRSNRET